MYDGIFFINHAINGLSRLSVYSEKERYQQTLETINSINKYCPNNKIFIFDSSPIFPKTEYVIDLVDKGVLFLYNGDDSKINLYSLSGHRSIAESISLKLFLKWFKQQDFKAKRIYKLSGRYRLNDNFILDDDRYKDAFVFAKSIVPFLKEKDKNDPPSWYKYGSERYYQLRFWHMDYSLLNTFESELSNILIDCRKHIVDIEHVYYKHLHKYKTIELDKIGVCGNIALNGKYIDE